MIDIIDVKRDATDEIYSQDSEITDQQLFKLYPILKQTEIANDSLRIEKTRRNSMRALINKAMKDASSVIEKDNQSKNKLISATYWFNPVSYFQNKFNHLSESHYTNYLNYRNDIQQLIDKRIEIMVVDIWNEVQVDKVKFLEYYKTLKNLNK